MITSLRAIVIGILIVQSAALAAPERKVARPLGDHPGNIFVEGEEVAVGLGTGKSARWRAIDIDGKPVAEGAVAEDRVARLGKLSVGWYEVAPEGETARVWAAVLKPLAAPTPLTSPIAADVAMAWFYKEAERPKVANLCSLAGLNWVRDRLNWGEVEKQRETFVTGTRYDDTARVQSAEGLQVLQVHHSSPAWAKAQTHKRFPPDLRDAWRFEREIARRWKGRVGAFEPWNEADIAVFGGHTGAEMASLQKASWWGLRTGNPEAIVGLNVFADSRATTLADLAENQAHAYFDTCNLHHYVSLAKLPAWYEAFRRISDGKPLWVSECSMPVPWAGDEKAKELADPMLRTQAQRVAMTFATSLHEGSRATFYFLVPHYAEGTMQFGVLKRDMTPRPAYVALAACGRLLADAVPLGKLKDVPVTAYAFAAKPDGQAATVVVAWSEKGTPALTLPASAVLDHLGRPMAPEAKEIKVGASPVFAVLPADAKLSLVAPPALPKPGAPIAPSPLVLQTVWPSEQTDIGASAYRVNPGEDVAIPMFAYNFSDKPARAKLTLSASPDWAVTAPADLAVEPMGRTELKLTVKIPPTPAAKSIRFEANSAELGKSVLSLRLLGKE